MSKGGKADKATGGKCKSRTSRPHDIVNCYILIQNKKFKFEKKKNKNKQTTITFLPLRTKPEETCSI